jgi:1,4-alpha-glucan branching enzyme
VIRISRAPRGSVRVTFSLPTGPTNDRRCSVVGDFNDWQPGRHELKVRRNGSRTTSVTVQKGLQLRFRYLAEDGVWFSDPDVTDRDGQDSVVCT